ncbi:MAG TPA: DUF1232 domain-containing protein [Candidatus Pacebacteria bacterium]|nr:DUF1232 domain-containing protein [Candidatus Paceibacterota bacterium]
MRAIIVVLVGIVSFIYLVNPTSGLVELIPDFIPVVGNLDEAGAMALLVAVLGYFGFDISNLFKKKDENNDKNENVREAEFEEKK